MGDTCASLGDDLFDSYSESSFNISPGLGSCDEDIFSMLQVVEGVCTDEFTPLNSGLFHHTKELVEHHPVLLVSQKSDNININSNYACSANLQEATVKNNLPKKKRQKVLVEEGDIDGRPKVSHIAVERNRRKQMNNHLTVLRSLMPCFYVKRGDQASIIGGVVDYITELQQVLQSLEAKKQRKVLMSPRVVPPSPLMIPTISPGTPQPAVSRPTRPVILQQQQQPPPALMYIRPPASPMLNNNNMTSSSSSSASHDHPSPSNSSITNPDIIVNNNINHELIITNSKSSIADVEVKFSGSNLLLKTISRQLPGQVTKIVSVLEELSLEILQAGINTTVDQTTMVNSFTLKIGIECELSAEDLVEQIQQTFC